MARVKIGNVFPSLAWLMERCAPAGYGWGDGSPAAQFNASNVNRTAVFVSSGDDMPTDDSVWQCEFYATSFDGSGNYGHMVATGQSGSAKGCCCIRLKENGVYSEWEWVNPSNVRNTEYRTTERWNSLPVYTQMILLDALPNAGQAVTAHGIADIAYVVEAKGVAVDKSTNKGFSFPCRGTDDTVGTVELYADPTNIVVSTTKDMTNNFGHVVLKYIKG